MMGMGLNGVKVYPNKPWCSQYCCVTLHEGRKPMEAKSLLGRASNVDVFITPTIMD